MSNIPALLSNSFDKKMIRLFPNTRITIDELLNDDNSPLWDIPVLGHFLKNRAFVGSVRDRFFIEKLLEFWGVIANGLTDEELAQFEEWRKQNPDESEDLMARLFPVVESLVEKNKAILIGELLNSYIKQGIDIAAFFDLTDVVNRFSIADIKYMRSIHEKKGAYSNEEITYNHNRLQSLGLIEEPVRFSQVAVWDGGDATGSNPVEKVYVPTKLLSKLVTYAPSIFRIKQWHV